MGENLLVFAYKRIFLGPVRMQGDGELRPVAEIRGSRPLNLCVLDHRRAFYGEYRNNTERTPIAVMGTFDGGASWEPVTEVTGIRHIHSVNHDPYTGKIWMCTGDDDGEAGIWVCDESFRWRERILYGSQQSRVVSVLFTKDAVYAGTDTEREANNLWKFERAAGAWRLLRSVAAPVLHGVKVGSLLVMSTSCEPTRFGCPAESVLWASSGQSWLALGGLAKDRWPMKLFQYGQLQFPRYTGANQSWLWIIPYAVTGHGMSVAYSVSSIFDVLAAIQKS